LPKPIDMKPVSSAVISIGIEILLGKPVNTSLAYLAAGLAALGAPVLYSVTIRDDADEITRALEYCTGRYDIVISRGGLGPTADDITKATIASFFGKELVFHEDIWEFVQSLFARRGLKAPEINRCQAMVPRDFVALENQMGTAPGLQYEWDGKCFFALAGVPVEMRHVFDNHISSIVHARYPHLSKVIQRSIHTFGISESALAERLDTSLIPKDLGFAWLPQTGRVDLRVYGHDENMINDTADKLIAQIPEQVWGIDEDTPAGVLGRLLRDKNLTISLAESCTGGLVSKILSDEAGASDYLLGGVVSYHNQLKHNILGVSETSLAEHGAVSEETALEMVTGIKRLTDSACAISVTGIAGPSGGNDSKPVGTVWFGFSYLAEVWTQRHVFTGSREIIRHKAAEMAILTLAKKIMGRDQ
jgi:nicotinamide-nucleotide amidase